MKPMDLEGLVLKIQLRYMKRALVAARGSKTLAARLLGMNRTTLVMRIAKLEKDGHRF